RRRRHSARHRAAFSLALLLNTGVRGMTIYRTIYFLPSLVPSVRLAILWLWIFNGNSGILNYLVKPGAPVLAWTLAALPIAAPLLLAALFSAGAGDRPARQL